jgi:peptidylprolyl isomerase
METDVLDPPEPTEPPAPPRSRPLVWVLVVVAVIAIAVVPIMALSNHSSSSVKASDVGPLVYDVNQPANSKHNLAAHWHAALGVYDCDHWLGDHSGEGLWEWPSATRDGRPSQVDAPDTYAGMHSHSDGIIHMEASTPADAGMNATVGRYFEEGGWTVSATGYSFLDVTRANGDGCGNKPGELKWSVNGKAQSGDPAAYKLYNDDVVVIAFVPGGDPFPTRPPSQTRLPDAPLNEGGSPQTMPTVPSGDTAAGKPCVAENGAKPNGAPEVPLEVGPPPTKLLIKDLKTGTGAEVSTGATVTVNYIGVSCSTGAVFDESYTKQPIAFPLTNVIPGFRDGLLGMKVGGRRLLGIPPDQGYGDQASGPIAAGETLWFVIDLVKVA